MEKLKIQSFYQHNLEFVQATVTYAGLFNIHNATKREIFKVNLLCGCCESEVNWILYGAKSFDERIFS